MWCINSKSRRDDGKSSHESNQRNSIGQIPYPGNDLKLTHRYALSA